MAKTSNRKKKRGSNVSVAQGHWGPRVGIFLLRVYTGLVFLSTVEYKVFAKGRPLGEALDHFAQVEYTDSLLRWADEPATMFGWSFDWYGSFLKNVMLWEPGVWWFAVGILVFEALLGISLILGLWTRVMAGLGAALMVVFGLAKAMHVFSLNNGANGLLTAVLLCLCLLGAGRIWGLDQRLRPDGWGWRPVLYVIGLTAVITGVLKLTVG